MEPPADDRALVAAAQAGDRDALDRLIRGQYDRIHAVCRRITGNESDAADAAQEALIAIVRALPRFDGRSAFSTWAYRIATNASLDELRRRRRRPLTVVRDDERGDTEPVDPGGAQPFDLIADRDLLEAALAEVPEDFRVPVVLRDVADLDYQEIADTLDLPLGTVKSRIARGRGMLAAALARHGNQAPPPRRPTEAS
ncbi:MAG: RNA polymerase sigma factor [Ilumatobacteraceae bacterium]